MMIRPDALESDGPYGPWSCRGCDIWDTICASRDGDLVALQHLLERDRDLYRAQYWYTQPIYFAVREGRSVAVRLLLDAGADPAWSNLGGEDLVTVARDRGHEDVVRLLESRRRAEHEAELLETPAIEAPVHSAIDEGDLPAIRNLLEADESLLHAADGLGRTPLNRAVAASATEIVAMLLELGADPNCPDGPYAPRGAALHTAARKGDQALVEMLLAHGADPNATIDSAGSATFAAATSKLRATLIEHGGILDPYDLVFLGDDDEALRRVSSNLACASAGCGGVLAAACTLGKRDLVIRLLKTGVRVPPTLTECRSYLWCEPDLLLLLLDSGMDPDLPDWQRSTPLHSLCERDGRSRPRRHRRECAKRLLEAGATITARDEDYRSTPLAWAARNGLVDMVALLLEWGSPQELPDDEPWATPLAWARRRGHEDIEARLS